MRVRDIRASTFFSFQVDGRIQSMFAQSVGISTPRHVRNIRVPNPSPRSSTRLQARRHPRAPELGSTAHRR